MPTPEQSDGAEGSAVDLTPGAADRGVASSLSVSQTCHGRRTRSTTPTPA